VKETLIVILLIFILVPSYLCAQVQMVTRPKRESVELTIYNSRDLTLVREKRSVTLKGGLNLLQFSWVDTLIDPTSIQLKIVDAEADVHVRSAIFPPRLPNTVQWQVEAREPGEKALEVSYFTSGLTWKANYIAVMDEAEKAMSLEASVTISNNSGEDYENAQTRLIVGDVKLVEEVRELAAKAIEAGKAFKEAEERALGVRRERGRAAAAEPAEQYALFAARVPAAPAVAEMQAVSEYYMYVLEGRDTIKHEWRKRKLSSVTDEVPIETVHRFGEHGDSVARFYQFKNDEKHNLGKEPLPRGNLKVFMKSESGAISSYIGEANVDFTPVGKEVKLYLGPDPEVKVKKRQMNIRRVNLQFDEKDRKLVRFDTEREYTFEIENYKTEDVNLEIKEDLGRDWEILSFSHKYEQKDAHSIEFKLKVPAGGEDKVKYEVRLQGR
jgi:hypothetical protein